jgi:hypothetical protein
MAGHETAAEIMARARARQDAKASTYNPPDYPTANRVFAKQKARLTRAINSKDPERVLLACRDTVREWSEPPFNGAWPDDWARWQRALDDALGYGATVALEDLS